MSKLGSVKNKARKPEGKKSGKVEISAQPDEDVNLSIKVPISLRRHWAAEAKREGATLTAVITEALIERFGKPE